MNAVTRRISGTAVLLGIVLLPVTVSDRRPPPAIDAHTITLAEVRRTSTGTLVVQRPVDAVASTVSSVFVVEPDGELRRALVWYGQASTSSIEVVSGVSAGERIVVSDMRAWDQFERLRLSNAVTK
jgi:hypothetical protein